jgi:hypothetical protein
MAIKTLGYLPLVILFLAYGVGIVASHFLNRRALRVSAGGGIGVLWGPCSRRRRKASLELGVCVCHSSQNLHRHSAEAIRCRGNLSRTDRLLMTNDDRAY